MEQVMNQNLHTHTHTRVWLCN